jgi:3-isopropylmalate/(R)-2-methylmalate dehydratase small subunit
VDAMLDGDTVSVDLITGEITNVNKGEKYPASPIPDFMRAIIDAGGLVEYVKRQ